MRILEPILRHVLRIKSAFLQQRPRINILQNHIRRVIINTSELTEGDLLLARQNSDDNKLRSATVTAVDNLGGSLKHRG